MKKRTILKVITLALVAAVAATVFAGCVFYYDEDVDLSQVILEIDPITVTYEKPYRDDAVDPNGNPVYAVNDGLDEYGRPLADVSERRKSATFGQTTAESVKEVRRAHDGSAIHIAKQRDNQVVYIATDPATGDITETTDRDKADSWETGSEYFVDPYTGVEYRFIAPETTGAFRAAQWVKVSDDTVAYGNLEYDGAANLGPYASDTAFNAHLPTVHYTSATKSFYWVEYTPAYETETYTFEGERFFKTTMMAYFNNYAQSLVSEGYKSADTIFDRLARMLYTTYLTRVEAETAILSGDVEWGVKEINTVNRAIYDGIDTAMTTIYAEIAADHDITVPSVSDETASDTTYPTRPGEGSEDDKEYKVWNISQSPERILGNDSDSRRASFEREGVRRFVKVVEDYVDDDYAMSADDRAKYEAEIEEMNGMLSTPEDISRLYATLYTYDVIRMMYGESEEYNLQISNYRDYLGKDISTDADLQTLYDETLATQRSSFRTASNYASAVTGGNTILYFANEEYFWVKHILIPFSDTQTANLAAEKLKGRSTEQIDAYRRQLGDAVTVYKHVNGENDTSRTYTINEAYAEIYSKMAYAAGDVTECQSTFTDLIYDYNTDPGIFDNDMGYAVTATSARKGGASETYMIEFAQEARALLGAFKENKTLLQYKSEHADEYEVTDFDRAYMGQSEVELGSISAPILTDYGWHIMFLSYVPVQGEIRALNSTLIPGVSATVAEALTQDNYETQLNNLYTMTQENIVRKYSEAGVIKTYKNRFQSRLDEYEDQLFGNTTDETEESAS